MQRVSYQLGVARPEAVMVSIDFPGERLEVEFFVDGSIEIERFVSKGGVEAISYRELLKLIELSV